MWMIGQWSFEDKLIRNDCNYINLSSLVCKNEEVLFECYILQVLESECKRWLF